MPKIEVSACPSCGAPYPNDLMPDQCPFCGTQFIVHNRPVDKDGDTLALEAITAFNEDRYADSIPLFRDAIKKGSTKYRQVILLTMQGNAYDKLGQYENAIKSHQHAIDVEPEFYRAWSNMGVSYRHQGKYVEATRCYKQALKLEPNYAELRNNLGSLYIHQNKPRLALKELRKAQKLDPSLATTYANMALVLAILKRFGEAEEALKAAIVRGYKNHQIVAERIKALKGL